MDDSQIPHSFLAKAKHAGGFIVCMCLCLLVKQHSEYIFTNKAITANGQNISLAERKSIFIHGIHSISMDNAQCIFDYGWSVEKQ